MISVLIASMGRPLLAKTLESLAAARVPQGEALEIVIADDSAEGLVAPLVSALGLALDIRVVPVGKGNVSHARNACLDAAQGDWLVFVDDDETVEPDWLEGHLSAARDFKADAVFGPVFPVYPEGTPDWFRKANPLFQDWRWHEDGRAHPHGRTGNTLIRRTALGNLRFDPAFGKSGGEDHDFFLRFAALGNRMVVTDRARAHEAVPPERANPAYALHRATRGGQIYAVAKLQGRGLAATLFFTLDAIVKAAFSLTASLLLRPFNRPRAFRWRMKAAVNLGKLKGLRKGPLMSAWG